MRRDDLSREELLRLFDYDEHTGLFTRLVAISPCAPAGSVAGSLNAAGYVRISIRKRAYMAHRLAWLYVHGTWPIRDIDHADTDKSNNRLSNLREADRSQNGWNRPRYRANQSGFKGVSFHRASGLWRANIKVRGKQLSLGYAKTPEQAAETYAIESAKHFGEFARVS